MTSLWITAGAMGIIVPAAFSAARDGTMTLARNGQPACAIVTAETPTPAARLTAL
ncbi:MAG: hypothetical protein IT210_04600 [Armatimonadetes bacterium]|nr:hypothetical protein [Armatimonadota bacterium]